MSPHKYPTTACICPKFDYAGDSDDDGQPIYGCGLGAHLKPEKCPQTIREINHCPIPLPGKEGTGDPPGCVHEWVPTPKHDSGYGNPTAICRKCGMWAAPPPPPAIGTPPDPLVSTAAGPRPSLHIGEPRYQDSIEVSTPKQGAIKVYGDASDPDGFEKRIRNMVALRDLAKSLVDVQATIKE